jgi:signal transduction histidine kinase
MAGLFVTDIKPVNSGKSPPPEKGLSSGDIEDLEYTLQHLERENERLRTGYTSLSRRLIGLRMLQHIAQDLVSDLDVDRLLKRILRAAINAAEGTAGSLLLLDSHTQELVFAVVEGGGGKALEGQRMPKDRGLAGWVVTHNQPLIVDDVHQDERFFERIPNGVAFKVSSQICVPLVAKGEMIGVIQVLNKVNEAHFDGNDLDLLTSFAAQSAAAIENVRLYQNLKRERDRLIAVEEEVRRRLARDLHDGPAQLLAALITNIEFIHELLDREPRKVSEELQNLRPLAQKALRQVRTLLFDLRPVILETQGLVPALQSYVEQQQETNDLSFHLQVSGFSGRLTPPAEQTIFSIIQEAVGNTRKHARAHNVWIAVAEQNRQLTVGVRDDGQGFDVDRLNADYDQRGSLGMLNMRERAQDIGGQLSIRSQPGKGTTIVLTVPLDPLRLRED